jgi:hypothetical protein
MIRNQRLNEGSYLEAVIEYKGRMYLPKHALVSCTVRSSTLLSTESVHLGLSERARPYRHFGKEEHWNSVI